LQLAWTCGRRHTSFCFIYSQVAQAQQVISLAYIKEARDKRAEVLEKKKKSQATKKMSAELDLIKDGMEGKFVISC
jgi:hypothetical protein